MDLRYVWPLSPKKTAFSLESSRLADHDFLYWPSKIENNDFTMYLEITNFFSKSKKSQMDNVFGINWNHKRDTQKEW